MRPVKLCRQKLRQSSRLKKIEIMLERKIIICEKLGTEEQKFTLGKIPVLMNKKFKLPACIVVPGKLHFVEEDFIKSL